MSWSSAGEWSPPVRTVIGRSAMLQCPNCGRTIPEAALFCPSCGLERTHVREQLQRQAAETGEPYDVLLAQARAEDARNRAAGGVDYGATQPASGSWQPVEQKRTWLWIVLGGVGALVLISCLGCLGIAWYARNETGISFGEGDAGALVRQEIELGASGDFRGRWALLHPTHREQVSAEAFALCSQRFTIDSFDVILEHNQTIDVPLLGDTEARVVTWSLTSGDAVESDMTAVVRDGDALYWTLNLEDIAAYRQGSCP